MQQIWGYILETNASFWCNFQMGEYVLNVTDSERELVWLW